jgi:hypothetical protein
MKRLAIDPGDIHVGWAYDDDHTVTAGEWAPAECPEMVIRMLTRNQIDELIIEEFVLYDWEAQNQAWSDFKTSQLIGALKLLAHWFQIPVIMQGANIKKPTRRQLVARGIKHVGQVIHARDAELHLYYRKLRRAKERDDRVEASG